MKSELTNKRHLADVIDTAAWAKGRFAKFEEYWRFDSATSSIDNPATALLELAQVIMEEARKLKSRQSL